MNVIIGNDNTRIECTTMEYIEIKYAIKEALRSFKYKEKRKDMIDNLEKIDNKMSDPIFKSN